MKHLIAALLLTFSTTALAGPGLWHDPDHPGHGITVTQDSGFGHGVIWFLHRTDGSSAFLIAGENCEAFPCVTTLHEPTAAWMGGGTSLPGPDFDLGEPVGTLELRPVGDRLTAKFDLYYWRDDCIGLGPGGAIFKACVGTLTLELLAEN